MDPPGSDRKNQALAERIRQRIVAELSQSIEQLAQRVRDRLLELLDQPAGAKEVQLRRDAWTLYQRHQALWCDATRRAWQAALHPQASTRSGPVSLNAGLQLVDTDVVENRILASRLALGVMEHAANEVNDLRKRLKFLQGEETLAPQDIVHPETLALPLIEQWVHCGLLREYWALVHDLIQAFLGKQIKEVYARCNAELVSQGVLPVIEFVARPRIETGAPPVGAAIHRQGGTNAPKGHAAYSTATPHHPQGSSMAHAAGAGSGSGSISGPMARPISGASPYAHRLGNARRILERVSQLIGDLTPRHSATPNDAANADEIDEETVPYARTGSVSPSLLQALQQQPALVSQLLIPEGYDVHNAPVVIERVVSGLRQQTSSIKAHAKNDNEKAIIELVALMFQSILQEDRIPTGVRVWFARLQIPVLRVALAEPEFFQKLDHPARQLIDRMGSCVLGFDASGISSSALETEIKRIVQVIEQYPETGQRVYTRVYEEFQSFLQQHLAQRSESTVKVVGVAQQVEQKETLAIQYTIELRNQIQDMPVRDEIREFLYKVWAEVLAVSTIRQGAQHADTLLLKKTAADLIWAASAKPNRADRAKVIADLPDLLKSLRTGMGSLGLPKAAQEAHIKIISDTLADAFMSKTQTIAMEQVQALAERLVHLEDYLSDDGTEELPLDAQSIEELFEVDASELEVITSGGSAANPEGLEWARSLQLGDWFTLDHNGNVAQVQYVWRSPMGHLHLFANQIGRSYLIQSARLAAYLQSGLLVAQEEEPLTVRATRDALGKIEANPERLLA